MIIKQGYSYDDILIQPNYSEIMSRKDVDLSINLTKNIKLNIPIVSANMDTITEDKMAIEIAKLGGLGILHRYCSIEQQVEMVKKVKRYTNYIIYHPYYVYDNTIMKDVIKELNNKQVKSLLILDKNNNQLVGLFTNRDYLSYLADTDINKQNMTIIHYMKSISNLITINKDKLNNMNLNEIFQLCVLYKIQKLPILNEDNTIYGLITLKDLKNRINPNFINKANLDKNSQLRVGGAIGVKGDYLERAHELIEAGCDILCIDVAHGHHLLCGNVIKEIKNMYPNVEIIAGNVCTAKGVEYLVNCGADCIKVGVGPGSICTTRKQTGCGVPQFTAVLECSKVAKQLGVTIIADGGHNGTIGNIFKALCAGATCSMLGGMISGTTETPGLIYTKLGGKVKQIRGMAGILSNYQKSSKMGEDTQYLQDITPEGVEGYVNYKGDVRDIINQIEGGIRSGLSYVGCHKLSELHNTEIEFISITSNGLTESGVHGIQQI